MLTLVKQRDLEPNDYGVLMHRCDAHDRDTVWCRASHIPAFKNGQRCEAEDDYQCYECECDAVPGSIPTHRFDSGMKFILNPGNGAGVLWVHYSADPDKNPDTNPKWVLRERQVYYGRPSKWNQLYEIDFDGPSGPRIYYMFDEQTHVDRTLKFDPTLPLMMVYDPGMRNCACTFMQWDANKRLNVLCELLGDQAHIEPFFACVHTTMQIEFFAEMGLQGVQVSKNLIEKLQDDGRLICYGDPAAKQRSSQSGISDSAFVRQYGWRMKFTDGIRVEQKIEKVRSLLYPDKDGVVRLKIKNHGFVISGANKSPAMIRPRIMMNREKGGLLAGFLGGYHYLTDAHGEVKYPARPAKDDFSHLMDTVADGVENTYAFDKEEVGGLPAMWAGKNDWMATKSVEEESYSDKYAMNYELAEFYRGAAY